MDLALKSAIAEWTALLGADQVMDGPQAQLAYGADTGGAVRRISGALKVRGRASVRGIMRIAFQYGIAVYPISTGRNWGYGAAMPARDDCMILDLSGLTRIIHFDPLLGVVTLEPGVTQGMLSVWLKQHGHPFMVPVTGAGPSCSLLGNALERGYGVTPHTDHFGAVTDLEAVLADGSRYRTALRTAAGAGLASLFKYGIGPLSPGLFTQSGFGVVTRMSIALARKPEAVKVCLFSLKHDHLLEEAITRIHAILGKLPGTVGGINLMNRHRVLAMSAPYPSERLDAHGLMPAAVVEELGRQYQIAPWTGFGTLYGSKRMVAAAQKEIRQALSGVASRLLFLSPTSARNLAGAARWIPGAMGQRLASTVQTLAKSLELVAGEPNETALPLAYWRNPVAPPAGPRHPARDGCGLLWYAPLVPMRPKNARAYVDMVTRVTREHGMEPLVTFTSINDKLFDSTVPLLFDAGDPNAVGQARQCYDELLEAGRKIGVFPYRVGIDTMKHFSRSQGDAGVLHKRLRDAIDPRRVIAPGRYE
ncbi:MAG: FAD-binding oxidoreductase [Pseudomonadota bacterium]